MQHVIRVGRHNASFTPSLPRTRCARQDGQHCPMVCRLRSDGQPTSASSLHLRSMRCGRTRVKACTKTNYTWVRISGATRASCRYSGVREEPRQVRFPGGGVFRARPCRIVPDGILYETLCTPAVFTRARHPEHPGTARTSGVGKGEHVKVKPAAQARLTGATRSSSTSAVDSAGAGAFASSWWL